MELIYIIRQFINTLKVIIHDLQIYANAIKQRCSFRTSSKLKLEKQPIYAGNSGISAEDI